MDDIDELRCVICTQLFRTPVSIGCGHTFCRQCLRNATKEKPVCPICRSSADALRQNITVASILRRLHPETEEARNRQRQQERKRSMEMREDKLEDQKNNERQSYTKIKVENRLLIRVQSSQLIVPFVRSQVSFRLAAQLYRDLDLFVAQQQLPYTRLAIIGRLVDIRRNLHTDEATGTFLGEKYFQITQQKEIECEFQGWPIRVKVCSGEEYLEPLTLSPHGYPQLHYFYTIFNKIPHSYLVNGIYNKISIDIIHSQNNLVGLLYSIIGILNIKDEVKYEVLTSFDQETRLELIERQLHRYSPQDIARNPTLIFRLRIPGNYSSAFMLFFIVVMVFFYLQDYNDGRY